MSGSYRDELDAALSQSDALRRENEALKRENAALREGAAAPPPARRVAPVAMAVAMMGVGLGAGLWLVVARAPAPPAAQEVAVVPALRDTPDAAELDRLFAGLQASLHVCGPGLQHAITVSVTFDASGAIRDARPVAPADLAEPGRCVARVIRESGARVEPFKRAPFTVERAFIQ